MMQTPVTPRLRYWTWERLARIAIFTQVVMTIAIAGYFAVVTDQQNAVLAQQAVNAEASNKAIITEIRSDLDSHAKASADRSCAGARELRYLVRQAPELPEHILDKVNEFTHASCLYVPPHLAG